MNVISEGFLVLGCGCTDCFPTAIFFTYQAAVEYGNKHCSVNPEGFLVEPINVTSLNLTDD